MCGIAGIYNLKKSHVNTDDLKKMTDAIAHRGPDGEGHWIHENQNIGFGHRRLAIIDLSAAGHQPMNYLNRYTITFNGEIYNYIEIKEKLILNGYQFNSDSDTEVVLASYDLKKEKCLEDFDGMFSLAIWDELEQKLFCARDRFGEKPFHYFNDTENFIFASEIKQFWAIGIPKKPYQKRVDEFIKLNTVLSDEEPEKTFFENIFILPAAHYLTIDSTFHLSINKYWDIDLSKPNLKLSKEDAVLKFKDLLTTSIQRRLRSDVPVGSSLSGGVDSSAIVAIVNKQNVKSQNTFSARINGYQKDEGVFISSVVNYLKNINRQEIFVTKELLQSNLDAIIFHQDEPFQSTSIVAQFLVMNLAKQNNVTVLLDGQGADEFIAGYQPMYLEYLKSLFYHNRTLYYKEVKAITVFYDNTVPFTFPHINETFRMKLGYYKLKLLKREMPLPKLHFKQLMKNYVLGSTLQQLLRYADRNSMASSIEVRLPFLSHELVEFVFRLPEEYIINNGWTKWILRSAIDGLLPDSIVWRKKKIGFEMPDDELLNDYSPTNKFDTKDILKSLVLNKIYE